MGNRPILPPERKCAECGKTFFGVEEWSYRRNKDYYCSWSCLRKHTDARCENERTQKIISNSWVLNKDQRKELMKRLNSGESPDMLARNYGISRSSIQYYQKKIEKLKA